MQHRCMLVLRTPLTWMHTAVRIRLSQHSQCSTCHCNYPKTPRYATPRLSLTASCKLLPCAVTMLATNAFLHSTSGSAQMRFRNSYADTMQVPHRQLLAMRGTTPRSRPRGPSCNSSSRSTAPQLGTTPFTGSATCNNAMQAQMSEEHGGKGKDAAAAAAAAAADMLERGWADKLGTVNNHRSGADAST
eukprot:GHRQ01032499.1.p1 GENE.GHRQ01032499.1~~GHRQ01032499.1.p1  ORF type:complete len:189 (-),score=19.92 GHRQ01032499.1:134-700(-)